VEFTAVVILAHILDHGLACTRPWIACMTLTRLTVSFIVVRPHAR
jgi:hypothetical protein